MSNSFTSMRLVVFAIFCFACVSGSRRMSSSTKLLHMALYSSQSSFANSNKTSRKSSANVTLSLRSLLTQLVFNHSTVAAFRHPGPGKLVVHSPIHLGQSHSQRATALSPSHAQNCCLRPKMQAPPNLNSLKVVELKSLCRARGLKVSGLKAELIARIQEHDSSDGDKTTELPSSGATASRNERMQSLLDAPKKIGAEQSRSKVNVSKISSDAGNFELMEKRVGQGRGRGHARKSVFDRSADLSSRRRRNQYEASVNLSECGPIVIAGGGIGGAAAAVALQSKGFDVVVLEKDASFNSRKQGYGLTMQRAAALRGLELSLTQDSPATSHYVFSSEGHILGFFGRSFNQALIQDTGHGRRRGKEVLKQNIQIPRQKLRAKLVEKIRPGTIRWNSKLKGFSCWCDDDDYNNDCDRNGVTVTLTDGTTIDGALLVGADGIFSTVRRQLDIPGDRLDYLGLLVVLGIVPTSVSESANDETDGNDTTRDEVVAGFALTQSRIFETVDGATRIYAMPFTENTTMWQLSFPYEEEAARNITKDPAALMEEILRRCGDWHDPIKALLCSTPLENIAAYPVYDREPLHPNILRAKDVEGRRRRRAQRRVTVIGDAAHPMSPFKGQGANQALMDAVLLADTLVNCIKEYGLRIGFNLALPAFEQKMLNRSARMVESSREAAELLHSSRAAEPSRRGQNHLDEAMPEMIQVLRAKGVGAHSASDPRGLDAVVADAIGMSNLSKSLSALHAKSKKNSIGRATLAPHISRGRGVNFAMRSSRGRGKNSEVHSSQAEQGVLAARF